MVIESQGYMVIQFKAWEKEVIKWYSKYAKGVFDTWNMILNFKKQMALRITEKLYKVGIQLKEIFAERFKQEETVFDIESRPKYDFVRNIGQKYVVRYKNPVVYHRCRNNC